MSTELIPYFQPGSDAPLIFRSKDQNRIITVCNAVKRMTAVEGDENKVIVTDDIIIIQFKKQDLNTGSGTGTPSGSKRYRIKSYLQNDYFTCRTWDGTTEGSTDVLVAKAKAMRGSIASDHILAPDGSSTIDISYSYSLTFLTRTATKTGGTFTPGIDQETQIIVPGFFANLTGGYDEIWASTVDSTGVTVSGVGLTIMDDNRDARVWTSVPLDPTP